MKLHGRVRRDGEQRTRPPGERGSAAIEAVVLAPVIILFVLLVIAGGQVALARQSVQAIAADTARTASLERTAHAAQRAALATAHHALDQQVACTSRDITLDLKAFGTPASVSATITCRVETLGLPGLPSVTVSATVQSPIDSYRGRQP